MGNSKKKKSESGQESKTEDGTWKSRWRWAISLFVVLHVAAIFTAPFTFATSSSPGIASPFAITVMNALRPYIDLLYLNHGYFFFAPNPGPSHLVRYRAEYADGRPAVEQTFPDRRRHWPRLLYHRHFMLSEALNSAYTPPEPPSEIAGDQESVDIWRARRARYEGLWNSYRAHLRSEYEADRVELTRVEHRLPSIYEVMNEGRRLNALDSYLDMPEAVDYALPESVTPPMFANPPMLQGPPVTPLEKVSP